MHFAWDLTFLDSPSCLCKIVKLVVARLISQGPVCEPACGPGAPYPGLPAQVLPHMQMRVQPAQCWSQQRDAISANPENNLTSCSKKAKMVLFAFVWLDQSWVALQ